MATPNKAEVEAATRLLKLARRLTNAGDAHLQSAAAGRLLGMLFQTLSPVLGSAGVAAIFARSVRLSKAEYPCLEDIVTRGNQSPQSEPDVSFSGGQTLIQAAAGS